MPDQALGYLRLGAPLIDDWTSFATAQLGPQPAAERHMLVVRHCDWRFLTGPGGAELRHVSGKSCTRSNR
jgi:hypothetical protein